MSLEIGCYYFPNYHTGDARNEKVHGPGWSEWELVKSATPRFPGHHQPNLPLRGFLDEKQPEVMTENINLAASHGINTFIFDWYYYNDGPFLQRALEEGFFGADNAGKLKFCTMWANHDWVDIHPCTRFGGRTLMYPGKVTRETFEKIARIHVENYFSRPDYYTIDGKPYFSVYELNKLLASFGSAAETRRALDDFRSACKSAGLPGLHLNCVVWTKAILPGESKPCNLPELLAELGFDSITSYVWKHHVGFSKNETPFDEILIGYLQYWDSVLKEYQIEYFPNVSMGWDSSPRTVQTEIWGPDWDLGYPFTRIITGNTPERFENAMRVVAEKLMKLPQKHKFMNINSWNEWTEGSYLEPDLRYGFGYLDAVRKVAESVGRG